MKSTAIIIAKTKSVTLTDSIITLRRISNAAISINILFQNAYSTIK
jgi:hypothetical protein